MGAQQAPGAEGDATNTRDIGLVHRADAQLEPAGCGDDVVSKAIRYLRERTLAGEPVRGTAALAKAIHVQRQKASAAVAQLAREKLIVNEAEQVGRGRPKPRLWACSAADFTRPLGTEPNRGGAS